MGEASTGCHGVDRRGGCRLADRPDQYHAGHACNKGTVELAEQRLYDARMNLVQRYWEEL